MEDESKSHLYLALGIIGIILFSICIAWLIVCCERCRRRRKFRPGITNTNPVPMTLTPIKGQPANKHGGDEWNHLVFANKGLFTTINESNNTSERSKMLDKRPLSLPNLIDVVEDDNSGDYLTVQIAAILGSFPNLKYMEEDTEDSMDDPDEVFIDNGDHDKKLYEEEPPDNKVDHHNNNQDEDSEGPETEVDDIDQLALDLLLNKSNTKEYDKISDSISESESLLLLETSL